MRRLGIETLEDRRLLSVAPYLAPLEAAPIVEVGQMWYVDDDAPDAGGGTSWADAFGDLQDALAVAASQDDIRVAQGVYTPTEAGGDRAATFQLANGVALLGGYAGLGEVDPDARDTDAYLTVLSGDLADDDGPQRANNGENSFHVVTGFFVDDPASPRTTKILDGFTITGGNADGSHDSYDSLAYGGGMYSNSDVTLIDCTFTGNSAVYGGGISFSPSGCCVTYPTVIDCTFTENFAQENGGAMWIGDSDLTMLNSTLVGNSAGNDGGGVMFGNDTVSELVNCLISDNTAGGDGGGLYGVFAFTTSLTNCTVSGNSAVGRGGGLFCEYDCYMTLNNSIFWGNTDAGGTDESAQIDYEPNQAPTVNDSCVQGWTGSLDGNGNIGDDPLLIDADGPDDVFGTPDDNPRLLPDSPCIDVGSNAALLPGMTTDLDGNPRIVNATVDMGAYESQGPRTFYVDDDAPNDPGHGTTELSDPLEDGAEAHPFDAIQEAIAAALAGDTVVVLDGTYTGTGNRDIDYGGRAITVRSLGGPDNCIIDAQGTEVDQHRGFIFQNNEGPDAVLEGVTITGGVARLGGGVSTFQSDPTLIDCLITANFACYDGSGAGMNNENSNPTLIDCTFTGNTAPEAAEGGGIANWNSSPMVIDCTFTENTAGWGGGGAMFNDATSNPEVTNCTFTANESLDGYDHGKGGALYNSGANPTLVGCTFTDNAARYGGAIDNENNHPTITDCTFIGNSAVAGGAIRNVESEASIVGGTFEGNHATWRAGAVYNDVGSAPTLTDSAFLGNWVFNDEGSSGGAVYNKQSSPTLVNCLLSGNWADVQIPDHGGGDGGAMESQESDVTLINCTLSNNRALHGGAIANSYRSTIELTNTILFGNSDNQGTSESSQIYGWGDTAVVVNHSCIEGWTGEIGGIGNMGEDPMFVDADGSDDLAGTRDDNLRLLPGSSCIDTGDNAVVPPEAVADLDGNPRIVNATVDMGAYEQTQPIGGKIHGSKFHDLDGDGIWDDGEPGLEGWTIYLDTDQDGQPDEDEPSTVTDAEGNYTLTNLPAGAYTVAEVPQHGWEQTTPRLIERASVAADGSQGEGRNFRPSISADGRYVAFTSEIASLVPGDTNGHWDTFVRDRQTGDVERVNLASDGSQANGSSLGASISADGRYVAFMSTAANLVAGDRDIDDNEDVFVYDRQTDTIECVSLSLSGVPANRHSMAPSISADGRFVAFASSAADLVPGDTNGRSDVFVRDLQTGQIQRISMAFDGTEGNHRSKEPAISADGRFVVFRSEASNLVPDDTNEFTDVFVCDRQTGTIERLSMTPDGAEANNDSGEPRISADGRYVAFCSYASNLADGDDNYYADTFVHDRQTGSLQWVSQPRDGSATDNNSYPGGFSADGRFLTFMSYASDLIPGDSGDTGDVFVYDKTAQMYHRVGTASDGTAGNDHSYFPVISADGRFLAFESDALNLVEGDTNDSKDIFVCNNTLAGTGTHQVALGAGQEVYGVDFGNRYVDLPLIVSTTVDENDGNYRRGDLSLREALALAADLPGDGVIGFHKSLVGGTIVLDEALGELAIDSNVDIQGPGANRLTVDADGNSRVFHIGSGADASIAGLTITGGWAEDDNGGPNAAGGGILNLGTLALEGAVLTGNHAGGGGGICNFGAATLADVTVSGNSAREGGGIANYDPGVMTVTGSVIRGNTIDGGIRNHGDLTLSAVTIADNEGSGITNEGPLSVADSTISGNVTTQNGGGIRNYRYPLTMTNTTISGNEAHHGGGLYVNSGTATLVNVTVTENHAYDGGGIFRFDGHEAVVTLHNTIVAANSRSNADGHRDVSGKLDTASSANLIGASSGLGPLADNGGPTLTHALLPHSRAIDGGSNDRAHDAGLTHDQRGFDRFVDADSDGAAVVDIGAYESDVVQVPVPVLHVPGSHEFDGEADFLEFEDRPELNITEYTIATWFRADDPTDGTQTLIARGEDFTHDNAQWVVELNDRVNRGKVQLWFEEPGGRDHYFSTETQVQADTWYHIAVTRSLGGGITVYLNGEQELFVPESPEPARVDTPVTVGARRNNPDRTQDYFDGVIHETLVYDGALDAPEIRRILDETRPTEQPDPLLHLADRMEFDGKDEYLAITDEALDIDTYSIAFWFQADDPHGRTQSLVSRGEDFATDRAQWIVQLNDNESPGRMQLWYEDDGGSDAVFATTTEIAAEQWYHFAVTRSADGEVNVYLDGILESTAVDTRVPASIESPVYIGARGNRHERIQEFFDGRMEAVAVFGEPLSAEQIERLRLDTAPDLDFRGLVYSHPDAIELDGVDDYLQIDDSELLNTNEYTIALSFQADTPTSGTQSLVARGEDWASDKAQWVVELNDSRSRGKLQLWYEEANDADHYFAAPTTIEADTWYHAVVTRSSEGMVRIYLDGQLVSEELDEASPAMVDTPVLIGARSNQPGRIQDYFDGTIEGVQIYNYGMTPDQVSEIIPPSRLELLEPVDAAFALMASDEHPVSEAKVRYFDSDSRNERC